MQPLTRGPEAEETKTMTSGMATPRVRATVHPVRSCGRKKIPSLST